MESLSNYSVYNNCLNTNHSYLAQYEHQIYSYSKYICIDTNVQIFSHKI